MEGHEGNQRSSSDVQLVSVYGAFHQREELFVSVDWTDVFGASEDWTESCFGLRLGREVTGVVWCMC